MVYQHAIASGIHADKSTLSPCCKPLWKPLAHFLILGELLRASLQNGSRYYCNGIKVVQNMSIYFSQDRYCFGKAILNLN